MAFRLLDEHLGSVDWVQALQLILDRARGTLILEVGGVQAALLTFSHWLGLHVLLKPSQMRVCKFASKGLARIAMDTATRLDTFIGVE